MPTSSLTYLHPSKHYQDTITNETSGLHTKMLEPLGERETMDYGVSRYGPQITFRLQREKDNINGKLVEVSKFPD
jgi:hypothetical protein